jgi:hypothetical protein
MNYTIHGPFEIKRLKTNKHIDRSKTAQKEFWEKVINQDGDDELPSACGCYLFAVRAAQGIRPWYVGLTKMNTFDKECFAAQKINIYNEVLANQKKGRPLLFLIAKRTPKGKLAKGASNKNGNRDIAYLENVLISAAIEKNPRLMNVMGAKFLRKMCVPGLMNTPPGPPNQSEKEFKKAIT